MAQSHLDIDAALKAEQERLSSRSRRLETELSEINSRLARITRYFTDEPQPSSDFRHRAHEEQTDTRAALSSKLF